MTHLNFPLLSTNKFQFIPERVFRLNILIWTNIYSTDCTRQKGVNILGATLYLMFLIIILFSVIIIGRTVYNRKKIACMTGMMIAMTLGMSVGLILGVIFGILLSDNFFAATILGMIVGMTAGFLAGVPVSIMAVLDGLLSGLMGGMMGAMLGVMIAAEYQDAIVKVMFFMILSTFLILIYMMQKEINKNETVFYLNPLFTVILFGFLFFIFNLTGPVFTGANPTEHNHAELNESANRLEVKAGEYDFLPNNLKIEVGETVVLSIENMGTIEHDLEIIDFNPQSVQQNASHNHGQSTNTIHLHANPGEKQTVSFTSVEPGV